VTEAPSLTRIGGSTRVVGIIGWPVSGSLSPVIHNAAFSALELDWAYVPMPVPPGSVAAAIEGLRSLGFAGANVTMPHKTEVARIIGALTEDATLLDAVNTIVVGPEGLTGHNTDAPGFDRFLRRDAGFEPEGRAALLFGGGGAARACALALARGGLAELTVALRDPARDAGIRVTLEGAPTSLSIVAFGDASTVRADLVVNATPIGAQGESLPVPSLRADTVVVDLLYRPAGTPLQALARSAGAAAFGGLGLLLQQAALSFELWTGQVPPLDVMSAAAVAALAEGGPRAEDGDRTT
jgi:shikimate dehydrogenase